MSANRTSFLTKEEQAQLSADEQAIVDSFENNDAIVAVIRDVIYTDKGPVIDFSKQVDKTYTDQIKDPTNNRPSRANQFAPAPEFFYKANLRTFATHKHYPGNNRNTKHKGEVRTHTAKMSATKPPRDPRYMELYGGNNTIGFHWRQRDCKIKAEKKTGIVKYVFPENAGTDLFFWALPEGTQAELDVLKQFMQRNPQVTLEALTEKNDKAIKEQKSIYWNEILIGFPAGKIEAVFATLDERSCRLRAYRAMLHEKEKLGLARDLPVYINQPYYAEDLNGSRSGGRLQRKAVFRFYRQAEIEADLKAEAVDRQVEQSLLDLIQSHRALALVVSDEEMEGMLDYQLEQLAHVDTPVNRPSLSTEFFKGKVPATLRKVNLKTFDVDNNYHPGQSRASKSKDYLYPSTVKTEVTLLPTDPEWMDFEVNTGTIALLFDYNDCDVKEKYIFQNANQIKLTDCSWLNVTDHDVDALKARFKDQPVGDLAAVKARNDKAVKEQTTISPNIIFARLPKCLPKKGVSFRGIACLVDDFGTRVKAWRAMLQIKEKFNLTQDLPIVVTQQAQEPYPDAGYKIGGFRIYRDYERASDVHEDEWMKTDPAGLAKYMEKFYMHSSRLRWQYPMTPAEEKARSEQSRDYVKRLQNKLPLGEQVNQRVAHLKRLAAEQDGFVLVENEKIDTKQESKMDEDEYVMIEKNEVEVDDFQRKHKMR
jgi:hypothetical protein